MKALAFVLVGCAGSPPDVSHHAPAASCPATFLAAKSAGPRCAANASCTYPEGVCSCEEPCSGYRGATASPLWTCKVLPAACPTSDVGEGTPCPQVGLRCEYMRASSCGGTVATCETTGWAFDVIPKAG